MARGRLKCCHRNIRLTIIFRYLRMNGRGDRFGTRCKWALWQRSVTSYSVWQRRMQWYGLNFKGKTLLDILIMVPWALPGTVVAVNLIAAFSEENIFAFNQVLIGTFWILPLAYFIRHLPLVFRSTSASLMQMDQSIEEASRSLGAGWWMTFRKIVLPLTLTGILAGTLLAFVQSIGEFVASILIYSTSTMPLSVAIFQKMYAFKFGTACAYGVLQIILILIVLTISEKLSKGTAGSAI